MISSLKKIFKTMAMPIGNTLAYALDPISKRMDSDGRLVTDSSTVNFLSDPCIKVAALSNAFLLLHVNNMPLTQETLIGLGVTTALTGYFAYFFKFMSGSDIAYNCFGSHRDFDFIDKTGQSQNAIPLNDGAVSDLEDCVKMNSKFALAPAFIAYIVDNGLDANTLDLMPYCMAAPFITGFVFNAHTAQKLIDGRNNDGQGYVYTKDNVLPSISPN